MTAAGQHRDTGREEQEIRKIMKIMETMRIMGTSWTQLPWFLHEDGDAGHHDEEWDRRDDTVTGEVEEGGLVEMTMITVETGTDIILCRPVLTRPSRSRHHAARAWPRHSHYTWKRTFSQSRRRPHLIVESSY